MALCPYANIQTFEINLIMMNTGAGPRLKGNVRFTSRNIVSLVWQNDGRKRKGQSSEQKYVITKM